MVSIKRRLRGSLAATACTWVTQPAEIAAAKKLVPCGIRASGMLRGTIAALNVRKTIVNDLKTS